MPLSIDNDNALEAFRVVVQIQRDAERFANDTQLGLLEALMKGDVSLMDELATDSDVPLPELVDGPFGARFFMLVALHADEDILRYLSQVWGFDSSTTLFATSFNEVDGEHNLTLATVAYLYGSLERVQWLHAIGWVNGQERMMADTVFTCRTAAVLQSSDDIANWVTEQDAASCSTPQQTTQALACLASWAYGRAMSFASVPKSELSAAQQREWTQIIDTEHDRFKTYVLSVLSSFYKTKPSDVFEAFVQNPLPFSDTAPLRTVVEVMVKESANPWSARNVQNLDEMLKHNAPCWATVAWALPPKMLLDKKTDILEVFVASPGAKAISPAEGGHMVERLLVVMKKHDPALHALLDESVQKTRKFTPTTLSQTRLIFETYTPTAKQKIARKM